MSLLKILHLPTSVGGNSYGLSRAERKLGLESDVLTTHENYLEYPSDIFLDFSITRFKSSRGFFHRTINKINLLIRIKNYINNLNNKYDVFHFNFGSSLFGNLFDLNFYNKKKKLVVTYNGCDCRQKYKIIKKYDICACSNPECYDGICNSPKVDIKKQKNILKMASYCSTFFYMNPDLKQFLPKDAVFLPYSISSWDKITYQDKKYKYPLKVVHAPSQRGAKGTKDILSIIEKIQNDFPGKIEFILVEGMKNSDAVKIYEQADILIDQILIGWYGALSVEAMKAGCAVMVYIRESDLQYIPDIMHEDVKNTFINCDANNLYEKIAEIIDNPNLLYKYKKNSYDYVNTWHNPEHVASITKKEYEK